MGIGLAHPIEGSGVSTENERPDSVVALAAFAKALTEPNRRREFVNDPLGLLQAELEALGRSFDSLDPAVQEAFIDLFDGMTEQELRVLVRLQRTMSRIDPEGQLELVDIVELGNPKATLAKL